LYHDSCIDNLETVDVLDISRNILYRLLRRQVAEVPDMRL